MTEPHKRPLLGLLIAQFFGAFNDNAWKMVVLTLGMRIIDAEIAPGAARGDAGQASS